MQQLTSYDNTTQIVTAMSDFVLGAYLRQADAALQIERFTGLVIFDLLVCNGMSSNRFIAVDFVDGMFDDKSCRVYQPDDEFITHQHQYFLAHPDLITSSVLSSVEQANFLNEQQA